LTYQYCSALGNIEDIYVVIKGKRGVLNIVVSNVFFYLANDGHMRDNDERVLRQNEINTTDGCIGDMNNGRSE